MVTLTYGLKRPETGDINFWDELEDNITQLDAHNHDGVTSAKLTADSVSSVYQAISSGNWANLTDGVYSQVVTMTSPLSYDEVHISFRDTTTKEILYLTCIKASTNTYTVYSNDSSINVTAIYR